ncbi:MAG: hypothetical protein NTU60_10940, partial [Candidatus Aminicenantes bacterium]|nr:hypothetical protein [Candidatus Aminicenantes bacterium]
GNVKIEYSTDGGTGYTEILASTANAGTYAWTVPNAPSENCLVRVSQVSGGTPVDASNAVFSIVTQPTINVTAPNGGESWEVGSAKNITWSSTAGIANVKIEYSTDNGSSYTTVIASTANTGSYGWTVPNAASTTCLVRISEAVGGTPTDTSDANYSIVVPPAINVTAPNGGENWLVGSVHNVTWTTAGTVVNVKIEYSTDGGTTYTLATSSITNAGAYSWTVPDAVSTTCRVRVSEADQGTPSDASDAAFIISAAPPTITLGRTRLDYGAVAGGVVTKPQTVILGNSGGGTLNWTATPDQSWPIIPGRSAFT